MARTATASKIEFKVQYGFCSQCGGGEQADYMYHWIGYGHLCSTCHEAMMKGQRTSSRMGGERFHAVREG